MRRRMFLAGVGSSSIVGLSGCAALSDDKEKEEELVENYSTALDLFEEGFDALKTGRDYMQDLEHREAEIWFNQADNTVDDGQEVWDDMTELAAEAGVSQDDFRQMLDLESARMALGSAVASHKSAVQNTDDGEELPPYTEELATEDYVEVQEVNYLSVNEVKDLL
ncbi:hypothetical protein [Natrinema salaciae]|uniref:hypothetical protein n=1 Tax=Natrinema salaciae TaxID=1186196 RepID=UPI001113680E|nr:hypothetical protein [Natrinema salaciae]